MPVNIDKLVDEQVAVFLRKLGSGGGKPIEQLTPDAARRVLAGAQSSVLFFDACPATGRVIPGTGLASTPRSVTAENDVLRDEGEAYGRKLTAAGVEVTSVRYNGMIHDFTLLNAISHLPAVRTAVEQAGQQLRKHLA
ncbi:MAG: hypothetical protein WDW38_006410 [Sanguina aurantia]